LYYVLIEAEKAIRRETLSHRRPVFKGVAPRPEPSNRPAGAVSSEKDAPVPAIVIAALAVLVALASLYLRWRLFFGRAPARAASALCYHKITPRFCLEGTWTTPRRFAGHVDHLLEKGYRFVSEDEFYAALSDPAGDHAKEILLTFDDGYEEIHDVYFECLVPRKIPVLVFVVSGYAGKTNDWDLALGRRPFRHLSWDQVSRMAEAGARFGSHGERHLDLTRVPPETLRREIAGSRAAIAGRAGLEVRSFSYPYGRYDARAKAAVETAGYSGAFSLYPRHANARVDRWALRRSGVYVIDARRNLDWKLADGPFSWFEEMKCRTINSVAVLAPILKRPSPDPGR
jgi:peptidoglycan/xylan/chitin deacetylase (PgdA/CDA1 family)